MVIVVAAEGTQLIMYSGVDGKGLLERVADFVSANETIHRQMLLILIPFTAQKLVAEGWSKKSIHQFVNEGAVVL